MYQLWHSMYMVYFTCVLQRGLLMQCFTNLFLMKISAKCFVRMLWLDAKSVCLNRSHSCSRFPHFHSCSCSIVPLTFDPLTPALALLTVALALVPLTPTFTFALVILVPLLLLLSLLSLVFLSLLPNTGACCQCINVYLRPQCNAMGQPLY